MKNQALFFLFALLLLTSCLRSQAASQQSKLKAENQTVGYRLEAVGSETATAAITISSYCEFLNAVAATDSQRLYDEKMESDLAHACVTRAGAPGFYHYDPLVGKQNSSIVFLSAENAAHYCNWKNSSSSTSTLNFNGCANGIDQQLKSNQLNFEIINPAALSGAAQLSSGGGDKDLSWEEKVAGLTTGIGAILSGDDESAAGGVSEIDDRSSLREGTAPQEEKETDPKELLFPPPQLHKKLVLDDTRVVDWDHDEEESNIAKLFARLVERSENHYETPDDEAYSDKWASAAEVHRATQEKCQRLEKKLHFEKQKFASLDLDQTILEQIAKGADFVSAITGWINTSISASGLAQAVSTLARATNAFLAQAHLNLAQRDYDFAKVEDEKAAGAFQSALQEANQADVKAEEQKRALIDEEQQQTETLARSLKPPAFNLGEDQWRSWEENLTTLFKPSLDSAEITTLRQAKEKHFLAASEAAYAWNTRTRKTNSEQKKLQKTKRNFGIQLAERNYKEAQKQATVARASVERPQKELDRLLQEANDAQQKRESLEKIIQELGLKEQNPETLTAIEKIRQQLTQASIEESSVNLAKETREAQLLEEIDKGKTSALETEKEAARCFKEQQKAKKIRTENDLKIERATLDQAAWRAVWPEEILHEKLSRQTGGKAFSKAQALNSETAWLTAQKEALELAALWRTMNENNRMAAKTVVATSEENKKRLESHSGALEQKKFWEGQSMMAEGKAAFAKVKSLWLPLCRTVNAFVNEQFFLSRERNSANARAIKKAADQVAEAANNADRFFHQPLASESSEEEHILTRAVTAVATAASIVADTTQRNDHLWHNSIQRIIDDAKTALQSINATWKEEVAWLREVLQQSAQLLQDIDPYYHSKEFVNKEAALQLAMENLAKQEASYDTTAKNLETQLAHLQELQARAIASSEEIVVQQKRVDLARADLNNEKTVLEQQKEEYQIQKQTLDQERDAFVQQQILAKEREALIDQQLLQREIDVNNALTQIISESKLSVKYSFNQLKSEIDAFVEIINNYIMSSKKVTPKEIITAAKKITGTTIKTTALIVTFNNHIRAAALEFSLINKEIDLPQDIQSDVAPTITIPLLAGTVSVIGNIIKEVPPSLANSLANHSAKLADNAAAIAAAKLAEKISKEAAAKVIQVTADVATAKTIEESLKITAKGLSTNANVVSGVVVSTSWIFGIPLPPISTRHFIRQFFLGDTEDLITKATEHTNKTIDIADSAISNLANTTSLAHVSQKGVEATTTAVNSAQIELTSAKVNDVLHKTAKVAAVGGIVASLWMGYRYYKYNNAIRFSILATTDRVTTALTDLAVAARTSNSFFELEAELVTEAEKRVSEIADKLK